jgi:Phosphoesterase family/Dockerin type I domain
MHDGSIAIGDTWVKQNIIDTYLPWAQAHNSLLILTFDEDSFDDPTNPNPSQTTNQITTIFAGPMIKPGNYFETDINANNPDLRAPNGFIVPTGTAMNHYNVLATLEDILGLPHIGGSFNRRSITDVFSGPVFSGPLVVPNEWTAAQAGTGNLFPFFSSKPMRYQQIFAANEFARLNNGGGLINRIAFRGHGPGLPFTGTVPSLQIDLSTTSKSPDALSSTFAQNVGLDDTQVFSGALQTAVTFNGDPGNFEIVINFITPFFYDATKGNLLLDVRNMQGGVEVPPSDQQMDGSLAGDDSTSRVYNYGDVNAATAGLTNGLDEKDSYGLVARFNAINAVSRKTHGTAGNFDIGLPLAGLPGVECRSGDAAGNYQIVVTFPTGVSVAGAQVTQGTGSATGTTVEGTQVFINLTGVANGQTINVTLAGVNDGVAVNNLTIPMSVLIGDVTGNGSVNASDISQTKSQSGKPVSAANFREDVTANGSINSSDISLVKSKSGTGLSPANVSTGGAKH